VRQGANVVRADFSAHAHDQAKAGWTEF
jgi:hypothetical protein